MHFLGTSFLVLLLVSRVAEEAQYKKGLNDDRALPKKSIDSFGRRTGMNQKLDIRLPRLSLILTEQSHRQHQRQRPRQHHRHNNRAQRPGEARLAFGPHESWVTWLDGRGTDDVECAHVHALFRGHLEGRRRSSVPAGGGAGDAEEMVIKHIALGVGGGVYGALGQWGCYGESDGRVCGAGGLFDGC